MIIYFVILISNVLVSVAVTQLAQVINATVVLMRSGKFVVMLLALL